MESVKPVFAVKGSGPCLFFPDNFKSFAIGLQSAILHFWLLGGVGIVLSVLIYNILGGKGL